MNTNAMTKMTMLKIGGAAIVCVVLSLTLGIFFSQKISNYSATKTVSATSASSQSATQVQTETQSATVGKFASPIVSAAAEIPKSDPVSAAPAVAAQSGCALSLSISPTAQNVQSGDSLAYNIVVTNQGSEACQNASMSVYYPDNESFVSASPKPTASNYYWVFGNMAPGDSVNTSITMTYNAGSNNPTVSTQACATADNGADACNTANVNVSGGTDVLLSSPTQNSAAVSPVVSQPGNSQTQNQIVDVNRNLEYASWVWTSPAQMTQDYMNSILLGASQNGINVLYVTIDDYLNIAALPDGPDKDAKVQSYSAALQNFIAAAQSKNIAVDVEAGWRDWAEAGQTYKAFAIVDYAMSYNATHSQKINAIQYDIEPYLLPAYSTSANQVGLLQDFVALIDRTVARIGSNPIGFSVVIPHFYDDQIQWTPPFSYDGITTYTYNHLLRILDNHPGSEIVLMSYRNFALGPDSSTALSNTEITEASTGNHSTKIIVAQETGDVTPSYVTFFGMSKADYLQQIGLIKNAFINDSAFGGIAVHYIDPFLQLQ